MTMSKRTSANKHVRNITFEPDVMEFLDHTLSPKAQIKRSQAINMIIRFYKQQVDEGRVEIQPSLFVSKS